MSSKCENNSPFGTFLQPNLHKIASSSNCVIHFLYHNLNFDSHNLHKFSLLPPHPFTVTQIPQKLTWPDDYTSLLLATKRPRRFQNYSRHAKFCHFMIFYSNPVPSRDTLGLWLRLLVLQYFDNVEKRGTPGYHRQGICEADNFYALHITRWGENKAKNGRIYTDCCLGVDHRSYLVPNFGQLVLNDNREGSVTLCLHSPRMMLPIAQNWKCYTNFENNTFSSFLLIQAQTHFRFDINLPETSIREIANGIARLSLISNVEKYIVLHLLARAVGVNISTTCLQKDDLGCNFSTISFNEFPSNWAIYVWKSTPVVVETRNLHFLTCYSHSKVSFLTYTTPFDGYVWIAMAVSILSVSVTAKCFVSLGKYVKRDEGKMKKSKMWTTLGDVTFRVTGMLFDQIDAFSGKIANYSELRILLACWAMVTTVLISSYKGLVILGLNAPPPVQYLEEFKVIKVA